MLASGIEALLLLAITYILLNIWLILRPSAKLEINNPIFLRGCYVVEIRSIIQLGLSHIHGSDEYGYTMDDLGKWGESSKTEWLGNTLYKYNAKGFVVGTATYHLFKDLSAAEICFSRASQEWRLDIVIQIAYECKLLAIDKVEFSNGCAGNDLLVFVEHGYMLRRSELFVMKDYRRETEG